MMIFDVERFYFFLSEAGFYYLFEDDKQINNVRFAFKMLNHSRCQQGWHPNCMPIMDCENDPKQQILSR